jgi:hypothetical protein
MGQGVGKTQVKLWHQLLELATNVCERVFGLDTDVFNRDGSSGNGGLLHNL